MAANKAFEGQTDGQGAFGRYQLLHFTCLIFVFNVPTLWTSLAIVFQGYVNKHHCRIPGNLSATDIIPTEIGPDGSERFSQCEMYKSLGNNLTVPCTDGWQYDPEYFDEGDGTIVMEWDLVCEKSSYLELSITLRTLGVALGAFVCTPLGDRFGRRKTLFICLFLHNILSMGLAYAPNFLTFCILSFVTGVFTTGTFTCGTVLATELCPKNLYAVVIPLIGVSATAAQCLLPLLAYYLKGWRQLQLGISSLSFLFIPYYRWCPESVRWCIAKGKMKEAKRILSSQAKMNGHIFNEVQFDKVHPTVVQLTVEGKNTVECNWSNSPSSPQNNNKPPPTNSMQDGRQESAQTQWQMITAFLQSLKLMSLVGVLAYLSFIRKLNLFGLHLLQANMSGDIYTKFLVNGAISLPGNISAIFMMRWLGRKWTLMIVMFMCSVFFIISSILSIVSSFGNSDFSLIATWLAVTAKPFVSNQDSTYVIVSQELAPTSIRTTAFGILNCCGCLGSILSPYIAISAIRVFSWLPAAVFGVLTLTAVFLVRFLPETLGRGLPSTTEEILHYPRELSKQEKKDVRETQRKEDIFGVFNKGFSGNDDATNRERHNSTPRANVANVVTYI